MKRVEVTVPKQYRDDVDEVIQEFTEEITTDEVEKDDRKFVQLTFPLESDDIDDMTEEIKGLKELETGDLTIEVLEQTAHIQKGKRREGGTTALSVQEMYSKAFSFAAFRRSTWALIALAAGIAVFGAAMENVMVVIGAMVIAPILGPFISASFGLVIGDKQLIQDSVFYGTFSILLAIVASVVVSLMIPIQVNPLIQLIADPGFATIPLSLFVGAAAALTFTTEMRETLAGVAVAIALVPPAAVVGISLSLLNFDLLLDVVLVLVTNVVSLILAGSLTFKAFGISPSTYHRQKVSEENLRKALLISAASILIIGGVVTYLSYMDLQNTYLQSDIEALIDDRFGDRVLREQIQVSENRVQVELAVVNPGTSPADLRTDIAALTNRPVTVKLLAVQGVVGSD